VAVPKRKMSRSNTRHRRSQWKAVAPSLVTCANPACGAKHLPHRACPQCGHPDTEEIAAFSATACRSLRRCPVCREPFEHVKEI